MARPSPYSRFKDDELTLRDKLAIDRTIVANERTLLGYVRTTLALLASGGSLLHFFADPWTTAAGLGLLAVSPPVMVAGLWHYAARRRSLIPLLRDADHTNGQSTT